MSSITNNNNIKNGWQWSKCFINNEWLNGHRFWWRLVSFLEIVGGDSARLPFSIVQRMEWRGNLLSLSKWESQQLFHFLALIYLCVSSSPRHSLHTTTFQRMRTIWLLKSSVENGSIHGVNFTSTFSRFLLLCYIYNYNVACPTNLTLPHLF